MVQRRKNLQFSSLSSGNTHNTHTVKGVRPQEELGRPNPNCEILIKPCKKQTKSESILCSWLLLQGTQCLRRVCDSCCSSFETFIKCSQEGGGDGVGTHQNTWDSCISPSMHTAAHCTAIHQISIPTPQNVAMLLKLRLLTLGEYKFGINWFSAKMWSVKPRKIKTPGGELCHVQLTLYLTLVTLFTLYLILVTLFTLYLTQVTLCAQSQFWWYVTTTPHLLLLLQCTSSILHHLSPRCELKFLFVSTTDICWGQNWRYVFVFVFVFVFVVEVLL